MGSGRGMCFWISSVPWEKQVILVKMLGQGACQPSKPQRAIPTRHPEKGRSQMRAPSWDHPSEDRGLRLQATELGQRSLCHARSLSCTSGKFQTLASHG